MKKLLVTFVAASAILLSMVLPENALADTSSVTKLEKQTSDSIITSKIKAKYLADKLLNPIDISVSTHHGNVDLKGKLKSDTAFEQAVIIAQSVDGVNDVNTDDLTVANSKTPLTDVTITAKIRGKILQSQLFTDKNLEYSDLDVETKNQVVYLKGQVASEKVKDNLEEIAKSTDGVKSIDSSLLSVK